jgi:hypothetical protein
MLGARATGSVRRGGRCARRGCQAPGRVHGAKGDGPAPQPPISRPDNDFPPCLANALVARRVDNLTNRLDHELRLLAMDEMTAIRVGNVPGSQEAGKLILSPQPRWPRLGTPCAEIELMI